MSSIESIHLPLYLVATNPDHVAFLENMRVRLITFLQDKKYAPKTLDTDNKFPHRELQFTAFAKILMREGLRDGNNDPVTFYDCCDFVTWLYHGFKWLNDKLYKAQGDVIMGFSMKVQPKGDVDITYHRPAPFKGKNKTPEPATLEPAPSRHTRHDWCSWCPAQMIIPLKLNTVGHHVASMERNLYMFFHPDATKRLSATEIITPEYLAAKEAKKAKAKKAKTSEATEATEAPTAPSTWIPDLVDMAVASSGGGAGGP